jgi:hypothetical protein
MYLLAELPLKRFMDYIEERMQTLKAAKWLYVQVV